MSNSTIVKSAPATPLSLTQFIYQWAGLAILTMICTSVWMLVLYRATPATDLAAKVIMMEKYVEFDLMLIADLKTKLHAATLETQLQRRKRR